MQEADHVDGRTGRRDLLKKGAVATGVIWAAPAILSFDPVAAASGSTANGYMYCFDAGTTEGWTIDNTAGAGNGLWNVSSDRSSSPNFSLHFGRGSGSDYNIGTRTAGTVTSPSFTVPTVGPVRLEMQVWREVENYTSGNWDEFSVSILPSGDTLYARSRDGGTSGVFEAVSIDLDAYRGVTAQIVLSFDSQDASFNNYEGIYVDDINVPGASAPMGGLSIMSFSTMSRGNGWFPNRPEPTQSEINARRGR